MNTCIEVKDLTKSFNGRKVVDKISFRVEKGEVFGLLGHNGAGKSTIIDLLLVLKKPDDGSGTIFGLDPSKNSRAVFKRVGVQLQSSNYQNNIRVDELCKEMSARCFPKYLWRHVFFIKVLMTPCINPMLCCFNILKKTGMRFAEISESLI